MKKSFKSVLLEGEARISRAVSSEIGQIISQVFARHTREVLEKLSKIKASPVNYKKSGTVFDMNFNQFVGDRKMLCDIWAGMGLSETLVQNLLDSFSSDKKFDKSWYCHIDIPAGWEKDPKWQEARKELEKLEDEMDGLRASDEIETTAGSEKLEKMQERMRELNNEKIKISNAWLASKGNEQKRKMCDFYNKQIDAAKSDESIRLDKLPDELRHLEPDNPNIVQLPNVSLWGNPERDQEGNLICQIWWALGIGEYEPKEGVKQEKERFDDAIHNAKAEKNMDFVTYRKGSIKNRQGEVSKSWISFRVYVPAQYKVETSQVISLLNDIDERVGGGLFAPGSEPDKYKGVTAGPKIVKEVDKDTGEEFEYKAWAIPMRRSVMNGIRPQTDAKKNA